MTEPLGTAYVVECYWAGVTEENVRALDARAVGCARRLADKGESVRYLGSILMREDEVVLCLFEGDAAVVRRVAEQAQIPFERVVESTNSRWPDVADSFRPRRDAGSTDMLEPINSMPPDHRT
jgi:hypothetical protein